MVTCSHSLSLFASCVIALQGNSFRQEKQKLSPVWKERNSEWCWEWVAPAYTWTARQTSSACRRGLLGLNYTHDLWQPASHSRTAADTHNPPQKECHLPKMVLLLITTFINKLCLCVRERIGTWFVFRSPSWTPRHYSPLSHLSDLMALANRSVFFSHAHSDTQY